MAKAQSVKYSVLTAEGKDWSTRGETGDMGAALKAARGLLSSQAPHVRVVKEFLDTASGRNVTTTIFDEKYGHKSASAPKGGTMRWLMIAVVMFGLGFAAVFAAKTFFL
jgi:hypothetical protein